MKRLLLALSASLMLCISLNAWPQTGKALEVAVTIANTNIDLEFASTTRDTRFESIEIRWYESLLSHLDGGVALGYLDTSQASNPITAGQTTTGEYLEIGLRTYYYRGDFLTLSSDFIYRYSQTSSQQPGQNIDWQWHQGTVSLQAGMHLSEHFALSLGVSGTKIDGEERASGNISQIIDFEEKKSVSGHLGGQIILDQTGYIGIKIAAGSLRGGRIYFQRWF